MAWRPLDYHSYLLRFWSEAGAAPEARVWRFSLEDPHTGLRHGFASLEALVSDLAREIGRPAQSEQPRSVEQAESREGPMGERS